MKRRPPKVKRTDTLCPYTTLCRSVDREFYVMQGEIYTVEPIGTAGELTEDYEALIEERPSYYVFNGKVGGLTADKPLKAKVGEPVRLYFGVGGPRSEEHTSELQSLMRISYAVFCSKTKIKIH